MTPAEALLWSEIQRRATGARFRRQVPIGHWIADFATFDPALVIEVDGSVHEFADESVRNEALRAAGFTILRFENHEVLDDLPAAVGTIARWVDHLRATGVEPE